MILNPYNMQNKKAFTSRIFFNFREDFTDADAAMMALSCCGFKWTDVKSWFDQGDRDIAKNVFLNQHLCCSGNKIPIKQTNPILNPKPNNP